MSALEFQARGPHPVGLLTLHTPDPDDAARQLPLDVWYPADAGHAGEDLVEPSPASHPFAQPHRARPEARPHGAPCPVIAFSHGNSGLRRQSTFLTTHLASWGFVVVAPDHVGNTFPEMQNLDPERRVAVHRAARAARPRDLGTAIDALVRHGAELPPLELNRIGALGHSFGGWTALKMPARDPRFAAVCALAPAAEPFVGRTAFAPGELPLPDGVAALLIAGVEDVLVELEASIFSLYTRLRSPRAVIGLHGADHFHFCDGIPLLHAVHEQTPREGLSTPVRPFHELLDESTAQRVLCDLVTRFFTHALVERDSDPCTPLRTDLARYAGVAVDLKPDS